MTSIFYSKDQAKFMSFIDGRNYSAIILLADANTNGFCLPVLRSIFPQLKNTHSIIIPQGETNKRLDVVELIWTRLFELKADRNSLLINVGGGMVSDIGGFAESTFKRGIDFVNIPTTLLAMVDACYGGKTGIDFNGFKNALGTFQSPLSIYINPIFLNTLNQRILLSGFAEMIKHSLISSNDLWVKMLDYNAEDFIQESAINEALQIKRQLVEVDPKDQGDRQKLNFGHSLGHAIESASLLTDQPLLHGEAIMLGMALEIRLSHILLGLPHEVDTLFSKLISKFYPQLSFQYSFEELLPYLEQDKKNDASFRMSLLTSVGHCETKVLVPKSTIKELLSNV